MIEHARIQSISARRITCVDRNIRAARFSSQISPNETACQIHQTLKDRVTRFTVLRKEASTLRQPSFSFITLLNVSSHVRHQDPLTAKIESLINLLVDSFLPQTMKLLDVSKSWNIKVGASHLPYHSAENCSCVKSTCSWVHFTENEHWKLHSMTLRALNAGDRSIEAKVVGDISNESRQTIAFAVK
jgi:hypothetical protein